MAREKRTLTRSRQAAKTRKGEALGWKRGLGREAGRAPKFYGVIVGCIVVAGLGNLLGINPISALVLSQILNGLAAIPLVFLIVHICNDSRVKGAKEFTDSTKRLTTRPRVCRRTNRA